MDLRTFTAPQSNATARKLSCLTNLSNASLDVLTTSSEGAARASRQLTSSEGTNNRLLSRTGRMRMMLGGGSKTPRGLLAGLLLEVTLVGTVAD